jgi:mediator of RNA polymerase II transcription subunit 12, fungi type
MKLLIELDDGRILEQSAREQILADHTAFVYVSFPRKKLFMEHFSYTFKALRPISDRPQELPSALPEILLLATDDSSDAPTALANSLWYNYRAATGWDWLVWDNTIASLRQLPAMFEDHVARNACSQKYAAFLTHVDQHLPTGFDDQVLSWFLGSGRNEIATLSPEVWDELTVVLLYLAIHGALAATTILTGLVYPIWSIAASVSAPEDGTALEVQLKAANRICEHLLLQETCIDGVPPSNYYEIQGMQTRRRDVFRHPHFITLVDNVPTLVLIEHNVNIPHALRESCRLLREALCAKSVFKLGIYRDLETVHRAFDRVLGNHEVAEEFHEPLIKALKVLFSEDHDSA